jgi:hypothetical protein
MELLKQYIWMGKHIICQNISSYSDAIYETLRIACLRAGVRRLPNAALSASTTLGEAAPTTTLSNHRQEF